MIDRSATGPPSAALRSALSNGRRVVAAADNRSASARRLRDVRHDLTAAIGRPLQPGEALLVHRVASLTVAAERLDSALARDEVVDADALVRVGNAIARLLTSLGLAQWEESANSTPKSPTLAEIIAEDARATASEKGTGA